MKKQEEKQVHWNLDIQCKYENFSDTQYYKNIILHIPHASTAIPNIVRGLEMLDEEEKKLIDFYTDELFAADEEHKHIETIIFPFCRLYCDVERLSNDPLESKGLGIWYHRSTADCSLRAWGRRQESHQLYNQFHYEVITKFINLDSHIGNQCLLIDCHSFSALPNLLNLNPPQDIDICIGFNEDETRPSNRVIGLVKSYFAQKDYRVGINTPFSNSKTFDVPGGNKYHSMMIEVNKSLYMNEGTLEKTQGFYRLHHHLQELYLMLSAEKL